MKKAAVKKYLFFLIAVLVAGCLTGCAQPTHDGIQSVLDSSVQTLGKLDAAADGDLDAPAGNAGQTLRIWELRLLKAQSELDADDLNDIADSKAEIKRIQSELLNAGETFVANVRQIKTHLKQISENGLRLSLDESAILDRYAEEIKEINSELRSTIGTVYLRLKNLRENYTAGNLEKIHESLGYVVDQAATRLGCVLRLNEISMEVKNLLFNREYAA